MTACSPASSAATDADHIELSLSLSIVDEAGRLMFSGTNGIELVDEEFGTSRYGAQGIIDGVRQNRILHLDCSCRRGLLQHWNNQYDSRGIR